MNPTVLQSVLGGIILAAVLWLASSVRRYGETLAVIKTTLVGIDGDNGLNAEVKALRKRSHEHTNEIHALMGRHDLLEQRVDTLESAS